MRLIDADALKDYFRLMQKADYTMPYSVFLDIAVAIDIAPTIEPKRGEWIDAVPVVRCKDCKCWTEWANGTGSCNRPTLDWIGTDANDFCSMGERKDDE